MSQTGPGVLRPLHQFLAMPAAGGILLIAATAIALFWANGPLAESYRDLWHARVLIDLNALTLNLTLTEWINDGLMTLFFFVVGLEIKREFLRGELAERRRAALPIAAALGGIVLPAAIYLALNAGGDGARGWGIPMATDIAFSLGVLSLLGSRVPISLKAFLLAVAIIDDIGAITVIALFYTDGIDLVWLGVAVGLCGFVVVLERAGIRAVAIYSIVGGAVWLTVHESGVHATIAGVALGLLTPARPHVQASWVAQQGTRLLQSFNHAKGNAASDDMTKSGQEALQELEGVAREGQSVLDRLEHGLHPWTSFVVIPLFAMANAGVVLSGDLLRDGVSSPVALGVAAGLMIGKPVGIVGAAYVAVLIGVADLPPKARWTQILGLGILAGIGFTVSIFITGLAFSDSRLVDEAKLGILVASAIMAVTGFGLLRLSFGDQSKQGSEPDPNLPA